MRSTNLKIGLSKSDDLPRRVDMTTMPDYLCLLYSTDGDEAEREARWAELPRWHELTDRMREAGVWVANNPLHPVEAATTVRVRDGDVQITDGPFATTKEILAGYYLLRCKRPRRGAALGGAAPDGRVRIGRGAAGVIGPSGG